MRNMMVSMALWALGAGAAAADPLAAIGTWITGDGRGRIEIAPCGSSLCGRLIQADAPAGQTDENNPEPGLRGRPIIGLTILQGFERTERGWVRGRIYDPETGRNYRGELTPRADGTLALKGCVNGLPLCRTEVWRRAP